jgi:hypothetical protein
MPSKICTGCNELKSVDEFGVSTVTKSTGKAVYRSRCRPCTVIDARAWQIANPERVAATKRVIRLRKEYGITVEEYEKLLAEQDGICAICGKSETNISGKSRQVDSLSVDHDHSTGEIRGLLCNNCNRGLGLLGDNIESLERVIRYLKKGE